MKITAGGQSSFDEPFTTGTGRSETELGVYPGITLENGTISVPYRASGYVEIQTNEGIKCNLILDDYRRGDGTVEFVNPSSAESSIRFAYRNPKDIQNHGITEINLGPGESHTVLVNKFTPKAQVVLGHDTTINIEHTSYKSPLA